MPAGAGDPAPSRPNGRPSAHLLVQQQGRKPLFTTSSSAPTGLAGAKDSQKDAQAKPELPRYRPPQSARRTNSDTLFANRRESSVSSASPAGSRIPQPAPSPAFSQRRPISLADAFRMAESEEDRDETRDETRDLDQPMDGSPSPAPRSWRAARDPDQNRAVEAAGDKAPAAQATPSKNRPDWQSKHGAASERPKDPGAATAVKGDAYLPDLAPGIEDVPLPSVEGAQSSPAWKQRSPEKSFAWQVDEDFTAGDLQVSDSPRIRISDRPFANRLPFDDDSDVKIDSPSRVNNPGSRNTRLDEIRTREVRAGSNIPISRPASAPRNTKLDEIRAREAEAEKQIPIPDRHISSTKNTKLDEIQRREAEGLTKRQLAAARLEEIKERNAASRARSPDTPRVSVPGKAARDGKADPGSPAEPRAEARTKSRWESGGRRIPDTPVTLFKGQRERNGSSAANPSPKAASPGQSPKERDAAARLGPHRRRDSRDVLRQLARAASSSPAPEAGPKKEQRTEQRTEKKAAERTSPGARGHRRALTTANATGNREPRTAGRGNAKPTVEFAGLRRVRSSESTGSKRSSMHSEADPIDRIEGEMKLFAPQDNYSEKGSVRAPSPGSDVKREDDEDEVEATPRPKRDDPLTMPTPRVTGAYVETPVTARVDKTDAGRVPEEDSKSTKSEPLFGLRDKLSWRGADRAADRGSVSEPSEDEKPGAKSPSTAAKRPRAQSLPRRKLPLKNSAKPPSVKDDLEQLQSVYKIDDPTLDDLEEVLMGRKAPSPTMEALLENLPDNPPLNDSFDLELDRMAQTKQQHGEPRPAKVESPGRRFSEGDLDEYDRVGKSLRSGLSTIRGIEKLKDQVSRADADHGPYGGKHGGGPQPTSSTHIHADSETCPTCAADSHATLVTYMHLPVPRLFNRKPNLRPTLSGVLVLAVVVWYALESVMCGLYCRPTTCSKPCSWSYDDPHFGTAIPVKLDQWTTGGAGRAAVDSTLEEVGDLVADVVDAMYGRDILEVDVESLTYEGKRAHRRRLRKKGLDGSGQEDVPPDVRARWDAWHRERLAREKARGARAMGYETTTSEDDEPLGRDERIW